jgi:protein involved in polysaccharide export with SLBB domain
LIYEAGGLKEEAYQALAELARTEVIDGAKTRHSYIDVDLQSALKGSELHDRLLERNDQLFVRRVQGWHLPWVVTVNGRVRLPGPYTIHAGERLDSVLQRSGGLMPDAYLPGLVFVRESVKQLQQQRLDESRKRVGQDIARLQLIPASLESGGDKMAAAGALASMQRVLADTENQQAKGRIVLHLRSLENLARSGADIELEDRDEVTIPKRPASVNVLGQVYSPTAIIYNPTLNVRDYLERAGGPSESADTEHLMVVKVDGSVLRGRCNRICMQWKPIGAGALLAVFLALGVCQWNRFHSQLGQDFAIYRIALNKAQMGEDPYIPRTSGWGFVYPPPALLLLAGVCWLSPTIPGRTPALVVSGATYGFLILSIAAAVLSVGLLARRLDRWRLWTASLLLCSAGLVETIYIGQINAVVLLLIVIFWRAWQAERHWLASTALAAALCLKLTPIVFAILFVTRRT